MSKTSVQQFSTTPSDNTDVGGINVNTGWPPSNIGPAFRELMAQLAALSQPISVSMSSTSVALTAAEASASFIALTGAPGGVATVTFPATPSSGSVQNLATDGSNVVLTTGAGSTITLPTYSVVFYYCDGTNIHLIPTQEIASGMDYWSPYAPPGYLFAYGQAVSRTTYAALFNKISTIYGVGDGSTTFNLPDKRGRSSIGADNMGGTAANRVTSAGSGIPGTTLGGSGGSQSMQSHSHSATASDSGHSHADAGHTHADAGHAHSFAVNTGGETAGGNSEPPGDSVADYETNTGYANIEAGHAAIEVAYANITVGVGSAGSGSSQNMPPGIVCNYIIYTGV